MFVNNLSTLVLGFCLIATVQAQMAVPAHANTAASAQSNPPPSPAASAAAPPAVSAFKNYRPFKADEAMQNWRAANDAMELLGGHMGHVRNKATAADVPNAGEPMTQPKAKP